MKVLKVYTVNVTAINGEIKIISYHVKQNNKTS